MSLLPLTRISKLLLVASASAAALFGQSTFGSFVGTVHDPSGGVVAACKITATNTGTGAKRTVITDSSGAYTLVNLEPGTYEISMDSPGFQREIYRNLELDSRQTVRVDGALLVATQSNTVNVSVAGEAPINTEVSNIAETKLGRELNDLPVAIGSRASGSTSAFTTLTTQPGVEIDNSGNLSVAGSKPSMLSISIDGISSMSPRNSAPIAELFPSFDGIAEIRVSEINNSAEFGGISDITTISKSGTNAFTAASYENNQNTDFDARNTFSATVPKLDHERFRRLFRRPGLDSETLQRQGQDLLLRQLRRLCACRASRCWWKAFPRSRLRTATSRLTPDPSSIHHTGAPFPGNQIPAEPRSLRSPWPR